MLHAYSSSPPTHLPSQIDKREGIVQMPTDDVILRWKISGFSVGATQRPAGLAVAVSLQDFDIRDCLNVGSHFPSIACREQGGSAGMSGSSGSGRRSSGSGGGLKTDGNETDADEFFDAEEDDEDIGPDPLLDLQIALPPLDGSADLSVYCRGAPLEIALSLPALKAVGAFFTPPQPVNLDNLYFATLDRVTELRSAGAASVKDVMSTHNSMRLDVVLPCPTLLLPMDVLCAEGGDDDLILAMRLGNVTVFSNPPDKATTMRMIEEHETALADEARARAKAEAERRERRTAARRRARSRHARSRGSRDDDGGEEAEGGKHGDADGVVGGGVGGAASYGVGAAAAAATAATTSALSVRDGASVFDADSPLFDRIAVGLSGFEVSLARRGLKVDLTVAGRGIMPWSDPAVQAALGLRVVEPVSVDVSLALCCVPGDPVLPSTKVDVAIRPVIIRASAQVGCSHCCCANFPRD